MSANANISQNVDIPLYMTTLPTYQKNIMQKEGTVKFFNTEKGFGFISQSDDRSDVFVHSSGLIDEIRENDKVSFDIEDGKKGPNAVNVKVI
jgi:CspA family cold shock protein